MTDTLETPNLVLRPLTLGDVGALRALFIDPDVRRWAADGRVLTEAAVRAAVQKSLTSFRLHGVGFYAMIRKEDGAFAGYAGMRPARLGGVELGAAVWPRYWRLGLALEACRTLLDHAFGPLALPRVLACADAPNFRSLGLIARLGFRPLVNTPGVFGAVRWFVREREQA